MKNILRKKARALRDGLDEKYKEKANLIIKDKILHTVDSFQKESCMTIISGYYPIGSEVNILNALFDIRKKIGFKIALPAFNKDEKVFETKAWDENVPMEINSFGVPEPISGEQIIPKIALIPLIAFDRNFNRIGYGYGYYDKMLSTFYDKTLKIGCAFAVQEVMNIPCESHDIAMDVIITEKEVLVRKCV